MAKSADAADLKSAARKGVGVQVPLRAPSFGWGRRIVPRLYFEQILERELPIPTMAAGPARCFNESILA